jgi:5'-phosphate synthase pdxT subunit
VAEADRVLSPSGSRDPCVPTVGVLALQGDVREHLRVLDGLGVRALAVRRPAELAACDALVLPGGESTTIARLARTFGILEPLTERVAGGMPTFGTCAGMILLADRLLDGEAGQRTVGGLDVTVRRNAFGRQVDSFEGDLDVEGVPGPVHAVFIRAPWVEEAGSAVRVLARVPTGPAAGRIVAVRQGPLLATSFHPEIGGDVRLHRYFVDHVVGRRTTPDRTTREGSA